MSRRSKNKNGKVPKITEDEYAAYLSALKKDSEGERRIERTELLPTGAGMRSMGNNSQKQL